MAPQRVLAILCLVPFAAFASAEVRIGDLFMPKVKASYFKGGCEVPETDIRLPLRAMGIRANRMVIGDADVSLNEVVPLSESVEYYSQVIESEPEENARVYFLRGVARSELRALDEAHADLTKAIEIEPAFARALVARAVNHVRRKKNAEAERDLDAAVRQVPGDKRIRRACVEVRRRMGQIDGAIAELTKIIEEAPDADIYSERGHVYLEKNDFEAALADFTKVIEMTPDSGYGYYARGLTRAAQGKSAEALQDFEEAMQRAPRDSTLAGFCYADRGEVYLLQGKLDLALSDLNNAIRIYPGNSDALYRRAYLHMNKRDFRQALADSEKCLRLNRTHPGAWQLRAWIMATSPDETLRDGKQAVESALIAGELTKWSAQGARDTLAAAYAEAGDFEKAVETQLKANELAKGESPAVRAYYEARLAMFRARKPLRDEPEK